MIPRVVSDGGFTLIEVSVAAILVVTFALAFASSISAAFEASRGNLLRQQATGVLSEELEYGRALDWSELAMTSVDSAAPMLNGGADSLNGTEAGFVGVEVLVVFPDTGALDPRRTYSVDGQTFTVWRYVTHSDGGLRRIVVLVAWVDESAAETLLGSTLISEVTARDNPGGVTTTLPGSPTTTSTSTTSTSSTTTTSTSSTTTTTVASDPPLVLESMTLKLDTKKNKQTAEVFVDDDSGANLKGATVFGTWSTDPGEAGYPFSTQQTTDKKGKAKFVHNDGHPDGTTVQFCVTDITKTGYSYSGGTQCVSAVWN